MSVDGGLLDNYPIAIFDQQKYLPNKSLDYNPETLGIFPTSESGAASSLYDIALLLTKFNDSKKRSDSSGSINGCIF